MDQIQLIEYIKKLDDTQRKLGYKIIVNEKQVGLIGLNGKNIKIQFHQTKHNSHFNKVLKSFLNHLYINYNINHNLYLLVFPDEHSLNEICDSSSKIVFIKKKHLKNNNQECNLYIIKTRLFNEHLDETDENQYADKNYYIVKSIYLDEQGVDKIMDKRKIWDKYNTSKPQQKHPDYIHVDQHYKNDKSLWKYKTQLKSQINLTDDTKNIDNKYNLVEYLKKQKDSKLDKMLLEQHHVNLFDIYENQKLLNKYKNIFDKGKVWIFKFIYSTGGENITIVKSFDELADYINNVSLANKNKWEKLNMNTYNRLSKWSKSYYFVEWVLQEYITNPMLYEDKKFHLRGYYLFHRISPNKKEGYILNNHRIFTARDPYKKGDYLNKDIHDTHFGSTSKYIDLIPDISDLIGTVKTAKLERDILYLLKHILDATNTVCYKEDKSCYHLFGSDIMITDDCQIKFIEINGSVGLPDYNDSTKKINHPKKIFKGVMDMIVDGHFPPDGTQKNNMRNSRLSGRTSSASTRKYRSVLSGKSSKKTKTKAKTATEHPQFIKL
jgi:hypothetical protein